MIDVNDRVLFVRNAFSPSMWDSLLGSQGTVAGVFNTETSGYAFPFSVQFDSGETFGFFEDEIEPLPMHEGSEEEK